MEQPNLPTKIIYHVKQTNKLDDKGNKIGYWNRIGAIWPTKSGNGEMLRIDYMPQAAGPIYAMPWPGKENDEQQAEVVTTYENDMDVMTDSNPF